MSYWEFLPSTSSRCPLPHKAPHLTTSLGLGCLGRPSRFSESRAGDWGTGAKNGDGNPGKSAGIRRPACQSCSNTAARKLLSLNWRCNPSPACLQFLRLPAGVGMQKPRTRQDLPSRRWAAGGEARTSTQPAFSRVSNFLGGAFSESLFLQKHRSTWHPLYRARSALSSLDTNEIRHPMTTRARLGLTFKRGKGVLAGSGGPKKKQEGGYGKIEKRVNPAPETSKRAVRSRAGGRADEREGEGLLAPCASRVRVPRRRSTLSRVQAGSQPSLLWQREKCLVAQRLGLKAAAGSSPALAVLTHVHTSRER